MIRAGVSRWAQSVTSFLLPSVSQLQNLHNALFELFVPDVSVSSCGPKTTLSTLRMEFAAARERLWKLVQTTERIQWLLSLLSDTRRLSNPALQRFYNRYVAKIKLEPAAERKESFAALRSFIDAHQRQNYSFAALSPAERLQFFDLLQTSKLNFHRRAAISLRIFYVRGIYEGATGRLIAGIAQDHEEDPLQAAVNSVVSKFSTPLKFRPEARILDGDLDYIVVGSGPAGSIIVNQLQQSGKKVLLLDAGPFFQPGTYDARAGLDFYEDAGYRTTTDGGVFVLNGWVVGGGSTINADMAFDPAMEFISFRIEQWREARQIPPDLWTRAEMRKAHAWICNRLRTRTVAEHEVNAHNDVLRRGSREHGRRHSLYQLNTFAPGASPLGKTDKCDAVSAFLIPVLSNTSNPVTLIPDALVDRILISHGKAYGVQFTVQQPNPKPRLIHDPFGLGIPPGSTVGAYARNIIVASGALGSPALLLRSKVPNCNVGRGFIMHPFMLVLGLFDREVNCHLGTPSSVYVADYLTSDPTNQQADFLIECASARPEIGALMMPGRAAEIYEIIRQYRHIAGIGILLLDSVDSNNRVTVDWQGRPEVRYVLSEDDKRRFRHGIAEGIRIMFKSGARKVLLPTHENVLGLPGELALLSDIRQAELVEQRLTFCSNQTPLFAAHMMASNKMGSSPKTSVVSSECKVWGIDGLFVADGSVFPGSIGANPMQAIYSIAKIFVDRHLEKVAAGAGST